MCICTPTKRTPWCSNCKPGLAPDHPHTAKARPVPDAPETKIDGWTAWHPKQGFKARYNYEGPIAYLTMDDACEHVKMLNEDDGTNNRTGWRAVRVEVRRVEAQ